MLVKAVSATGSSQQSNFYEFIWQPILTSATDTRLQDFGFDANVIPDPRYPQPKPPTSRAPAKR